MIKRKECSVEGCTYPIWARKKCKSHDAVDFPDKHGGSLRKTFGVATHDAIKFPTVRKIRQRIPIKKVDKPDYWNRYYKPIIFGSDGKFVCEETGEVLNFELDIEDYTKPVSWCAHILEKSKFPTVATDHKNCIILSGMYSKHQAHAEFDSTWVKASKMKVAGKAIKYIESVMDSLTFDEKRRASGILEILKLENNN